MTVRSLLPLGLLAVLAAVASAADPQWYVRKPTWRETLQASRERWEKTQAERPKATPLPDFGKDDFTLAAWVRTRHAGTIIAKAPAQGKWVPQGKSLFIRDGVPTFDVGWVGAVASVRVPSKGQWATSPLGPSAPWARAWTSAGERARR